MHAVASLILILQTCLVLIRQMRLILISQTHLVLILQIRPVLILQPRPVLNRRERRPYRVVFASVAVETPVPVALLRLVLSGQHDRRRCFLRGPVARSQLATVTRRGILARSIT